MAVTGATKGTFRYTIKNIGAWVKSKFTPSSEKATYDTTTGTAYAGTPSKPQEPPTSIAYGGRSGRGGGGGGSSYTPPASTPTTTKTPTTTTKKLTTTKTQVTKQQTKSQELKKTQEASQRERERRIRKQKRREERQRQIRLRKEKRQERKDERKTRGVTITKLPPKIITKKEAQDIAPGFEDVIMSEDDVKISSSTTDFMSATEDFGGSGRFSGINLKDTTGKGSPIVNVTGSGFNIASAYPTGAGGTALITPLTFEQTQEQQKAQFKGSFGQFPPIKFLGGEYDWQKKLDEKAKKSEPTKFDKFLGYEGYKQKETQDLFGGDYSYKELTGKGAYPTIVRKGYADILGGGSIWGAEKITGVELPLKVKQKTKEQIGTLGLWFGFAPAMKTGTYAQQLEQQATSEWIYDYVKRRWVKKSKLTGEITRAEATSGFGEMSETRQLNILRKAFRTSGKDKRIYLDRGSLLKDVEKAKQFMREAGLNEIKIQNRIDKLFPQLKKIEIPVVQQEGFALKQTQKSMMGEMAFDIPRQIPVGQIGAVTGLDASMVRQVSWIKELQKTKQDYLSKSILSQDYSQVQKNKLANLTKSISALDSLTTQTSTFQTPIFKTPPTPTYPTPKPEEIIERPTIVPIRIKLRKKDKRKKQIEEEMKKPHDVFIKEKGKYKKVTKNPVKDYRRALDIGSFYTDNLLSAQFKVRTSKKKAKVIKNIPKNYYQISQQKFRPYKIRAKQKIPLVRQFIEKSHYRLDTPTEVRKINFAKFQAERRKSQQGMINYNKNINNMFGFQQFQQPRKQPQKSKKKVAKMKDISGYDSNLNLI